MTWIKVYNNDSFLVDYCVETDEIRVSYFEDNHFKDEVIFKLDVECIDYVHYDNDKRICVHPYIESYINNNLYWPKLEV